MLNRFTSTEELDIKDIREEMNILRVEVRYLKERHMTYIHLIMPLVIQMSYLHGPRCSALLVENDENVLIIGFKRGHRGRFSIPITI